MPEDKKQKPKEITIQVFHGDVELPADELKVIMKFDEQTAEVNLQNAVIRSMVLAQENIVLKHALTEMKAALTGDSIAPQRFYEGQE